MSCHQLVLACFREAEEKKPPKEKQDGKEKSSASRRGNRYHPYKDKHGGEKKGAHRNRVFISNIPYDMKWQAIKDLMREKGNVPVTGCVSVHTLCGLLADGASCLQL